ncbi:MAG: FAD-binding and (Fe-S)-binding domain-containing protein [Desulfopila sp.]
MKSENISEVINELSRRIDGEVRFDHLTRQLYSTDASDYQKQPVGVVIPRNSDDVQAAIEIAGKCKIPIIPRGGGSSVSGQTVGTGLVIDHSKYINDIIELNIEEQWVEVESGVVLDVLNGQLAPHGLMVGPDPSSSAVATIGGMAGNNSTGSHSFVHGMMTDHIHQLEVVGADGSKLLLGPKTTKEIQELATRTTLEGRLYRSIPPLLERYEQQIRANFPQTWRNVAGYNLDRLLKAKDQGAPFNLAHLVAGSEGTLGAITRIRLNVVKRPQAVRLAIFHFDSLASALREVPVILEHRVSAVELMARPTLQLAYDHPAIGPRLRTFVKDVPGAILIVEFAGDSTAELADEAAKLEQAMRRGGYRDHVSHCATAEEIGRVWQIRKSVFGLIVSKPGDDKPVWVIDDASVPIAELTPYTEEVIAIGHQFGIDINFDAHASAGCLHMGLDLNLKTREGLQNLELLMKRIMSVAIAHHGSTTGEHGEGLARSYFNEQLYGKEMHQAFREVKVVFDPDNLFNPHKIIDGIEPWDTDWLKFTPSYRTPFAPTETFFDFSHYGGFAGLVEMCNGQGICRSQVAGTMCPSYRLTRDEKDTTRGRANILRAAMTGEFGQEGLLAREAYEALDLCLACKACRTECSTRVDMAKLKYEFLAQYQARHGIPLRSRMIGHLEMSSKLGSLAPGLANAVYGNALFRGLLERTLKIDRRRSLPRLADKPFRQWCGHLYSQAPLGTKSVILWDDCYIRYNKPGLGTAAVKVLEALGLRVICLENHSCCGRPMISKGMLKQAIENARKNVEILVQYVRQGLPVIGVEPSCIATFRDEYPDLLKTPEAREVAAQSFFFEEFVTREDFRQTLRQLLPTDVPAREILVHTHCYQKALGTAERVLEMLSMLPNTVVTESGAGCCGMAGAFGYEKEHYEASMAIGEQVLFPVVRAAGEKTIIAAAGTSCREQIQDGTKRKPCHPIEILAAALPAGA